AASDSGAASASLMSSRWIACSPKPRLYISAFSDGGSLLFPETRYTATIMRAILSSIEGEWRRYKVLAERALEQTRDEELTTITSEGSNSIAVIVAHISGNLKSRFTDFLTADGEKPWRDRDAEFEPRMYYRCDCSGAWARTGHAIKMSFMSRNRSGAR